MLILFTIENPLSTVQNDIRYPLVFPGEVYTSPPRNLMGSKLGWVYCMQGSFATVL